MEVTTLKRMELIMLVAALILWSSIGADASSITCKLSCAVICAGSGSAFCLPDCIKKCEGESLTSSVFEHCDVGCFLSTCLNYHPESSKVGVDVKKVEACADSCSQDCQKAYPLH